MIFEPQPLEFLKVMKHHHVFLLCAKKVEYLSELGVDYIAVAKFDHHFRSLSAEAFADILKDKLNAAHLVLGMIFTLVKPSGQ